MTVQTKRFIELPDILRFRFDCKHCGVSVSIPLDGNAVNATAACPGCNKPWTVLDGISYQKLITDLASAVNRLKLATAEGETSVRLGFRLLIEITPEA